MLEGTWAEAVRHNLPLAFLMIDLDGFKTVNDNLGHQRGDDLLRLAARVLRANCRQVDVAARYGGDEFCVLMPHTEADEALAVADRILREFDIAAGSIPGQPEISMSIGVSQINLSRPINADQLVSHADQAMYAAKSGGKKRVMIREREGVRFGQRSAA
jgi:diguanylate cyclase (GGDEF)-like protein